jgi:hypothetical protein
MGTRWDISTQSKVACDTIKNKEQQSDQHNINFIKS